MARVDFKGIYSLWTPLKSKGEGMGQILLSHIRILNKMPFPDRLKRWEAGRASSEDVLLQVLDGKKFWVQQRGVQPQGLLLDWPPRDIQGHNQWLWLTAGLSGIWIRLFSPEESCPGVQVPERQKGQRKAAVCIKGDPCSSAPAETDSLRGPSFLWGTGTKIGWWEHTVSEINWRSRDSPGK